MERFVRILLLFTTPFLFAQGIERFNTTDLTENFKDGSFGSETSGTTVVYYHCRNAGDYPISGEGIMLRRNDADPSPSAVEFHIPNGVGEFSFQYRKAFTGGNNRILTVTVNQEEVFLSPIFGNTSGEDSTIYTQTIPVFKEGNVVIRIAFPTSIANGNRHVTIDNVAWTSVLPAPIALSPSYVSVDHFIPNWEYAHAYDSIEINVFDYKNRVITQTESFEHGLDTTGYEALWEADLIGGRWILDHVLRTTQRYSGNYGAQLQADQGQLTSPVFFKPKSISFYAKKGTNDTSVTLRVMVNDEIIDLINFPITNDQFQLFTYAIPNPPDEAQFIFKNGSRVLYLDDLTIVSEGVVKELLPLSPYSMTSMSASFPILDLEPDTTYFYTVRAKKEGLSSALSNEIELKTKDGVVWDGNEWLYGEPLINKVAILRGEGSRLTSFEAKSLHIEEDIVIPSATSIVLDNEYDNSFHHSVVFQEGAYLVQRNSSAMNKGHATFIRNARFYGYDSKFWSTPVSGQKILKSAENDDTGFIFNPSAVYNYDEANRHWIRSTDLFFQPAKGTAIQVGTNYPFMGNDLGIPFTGKFTGVPHHGTYHIPATKSANGLGDHGVGNPYPSPLSMEKFLAKNPLVKTLYFWNEHAHYVPGSFPARYHTQTWYAYNRTGSSMGAATHIGPGVGFIARISEDTTMVFEDSMREVTSSSITLNRPSLSKDRYWLSLNFQENQENQILIGYVEGATNGFDEQFDARHLSLPYSFILSYSNQQPMIIEGRQAPFDIRDRVPLYFRANASGEYAIKLEQKEGVFESNPIYLVDTENQIKFNLSKEDPYEFGATAGDYPSRFYIEYEVDPFLSLPSNEVSDDLIVYRNNDQLEIRSTQEILSLNVFSSVGEQVHYEENIYAKHIHLPMFGRGVFHLRLTLSNGRVKHKSIIL